MLRNVMCILVFVALVAHNAGADDGDAVSSHVNRRSDFLNSRLRFERDRQGHVAFIGGSITEMDGYRPMVCADLQARFPDCEFTLTDAGIASTCSTTGAFRLESDVLSKGPVDLFLIEFAVNDDQDAAHARRECIRGLEGILRHALQHNPQIDIVVTCFVNPDMLATLQSGETPLTIEAHESVAVHYGVSSVNLAAEVAEQISGGRLTWDEYGGTHPKPLGNRICADLIKELLEAAWTDPLEVGARPVPHMLPSEPIDALSYVHGRFIAADEVRPGTGWRRERPDWSSLAGQCRERFRNLTLFVADDPGAELTFEFSGTAAGAYVLAGPDAGRLESSIDDGPFEAVELYHRFSKGLHYPRTVIFHADLQQGDHTVRLRVASERDERSNGHSVRVVQFVVN